MKSLPIHFLSILILVSFCAREDKAPLFTGAENEVVIMNLNPGHFHAGLVHLHNYPQVDPNVYVYAPGGDELNNYLNMVERFNTRPQNPTRWNTQIYTGSDYLSRMISEKPGNVMVVAGNNARKIEYIHRAVQNGIHVLSDKPMIITPDQFSTFQQALQTADEQGLVVNDMMTERNEITSMIQRALIHSPELFGELIPGTPDHPGIMMESVHFFYKTVAGATLIRPPWFFDVNQQGEAIVDVSTHLVDKILWQLFPDEPIDYRNPADGVEVVQANVWPTDLTRSQFERITTVEEFPEYVLSDVVQDSILKVNANGDFVFRVRDVYAKAAVLWGFTNPDGGDTHYAVTRGTKANLVVRQDVEQNFVATLYVEPGEQADPDNFGTILSNTLSGLSGQFPGLSTEWTEFGWKINIPSQLVKTHEEHFTTVTQNYLEALVRGYLPEWERTNLETKYYITTQAYSMSR